ncbi:MULTISPECIES: hypothetical protein [unclassified Nocardia]|uniref:hypothetical protein n=1 Tax=unclassified Nocardia TaxID=2637762 RepID=UPI001CE45EE5|nr:MULTISPECIES: hypothetical protein [unclassified Nocardia]
MTRSARNPVLAPLRRWVLYSRTNLAVTIIAILAVLILIGRLIGQSPTGTPNSAAPGPVAEAAPSTAAQSLSYELAEVSETAVAAKPAQWATSSAPAAAMAYVHTYVDQSLTPTQWAAKLARFAAETPGDSFAAARPQVPVAITGPTHSELVIGAAGARVAQVSVPTQAGTMKLTLKVVGGGGDRKWLVDAPLPTLDLAALAQLSPGPSASRTAAPTTSPSRPTSSAPSSRPISPSSPSGSPSPSPGAQSGPIPNPELDTPLPGTR